jgi:hypothetical protein
VVHNTAVEWGAGWGVGVAGGAGAAEGGPALDRAVALLAEKYPQYAAEPPPGPAVLIDVETWRWWSYAGVASRSP